jgi:3-hydroxyacyl-CoA dehydrogenase/enoyl-CoA hydratase/3-hydroxybutyryl-CoA epimerase
MINEAISCPHDGIIEDTDLLDTDMLFGIGFALFQRIPFTMYAPKV